MKKKIAVLEDLCVWIELYSYIDRLVLENPLLDAKILFNCLLKFRFFEHNREVYT